MLKRNTLTSVMEWVGNEVILTISVILAIASLNKELIDFTAQ